MGGSALGDGGDRPPAPRFRFELKVPISCGAAGDSGVAGGFHALAAFVSRSRRVQLLCKSLRAEFGRLVAWRHCAWIRVKAIIRGHVFHNAGAPFQQDGCRQARPAPHAAATDPLPTGPVSPHGSDALSLPPPSSQ